MIPPSRTRAAVQYSRRRIWTALDPESHWPLATTCRSPAGITLSSSSLATRHHPLPSRRHRSLNRPLPTAVCPLRSALSPPRAALPPRTRLLTGHWSLATGHCLQVVRKPSPAGYCRSTDTELPKLERGPISPTKLSLLFFTDEAIPTDKSSHFLETQSPRPLTRRSPPVVLSLVDRAADARSDRFACRSAISRNACALASSRPLALAGKSNPPIDQRERVAKGRRR